MGGGKKATPDQLGEIGQELKSYSISNCVPAFGSALTLKEMNLKQRLFAALGDRFARLAALFLCTSLTLPGLAYVGTMDLFAAPAVSSSIVQLPMGVKVLARVPLQGTPITRMYTQREYGHTFLYIEHGQQAMTTVDVSKKRSPRIVEHQPAEVEPVRYEAASEGGLMEVWPRHVMAGIDSHGGRGTPSVLDSSNTNDVQLMQAFVAENTNLVDRDSGLVYFASSSQLFIVQDSRPTAFDLTNYTN